MRGIAELHQEVQGKKYRYNKPGLEQAPWEVVSSFFRTFDFG